MSLVIDLPPEKESQIRRAAESEGIDLSAFVYKSLSPHLNPDLQDALSDSELLSRIQTDFPASFWRRFTILTAKRDAGTLTALEWKELASSAEAIEGHDAERLLSLNELSHRRGLSIRELIAELGLRIGSNE